MKKLISVVLALAMVLSLSAVAFAADTITLYCAAPDSWTTCNCYAWNSEGNNSWPGIPMTKGENGIWYVELDSSYDNVIFNNGSGAQSADLTMPTDDKVQFNYADKEWVTYGTAAGEITMVTVYCNVEGWGTPTAYWWGSGLANSKAWPGNAMTQVDGSVYSIEVPSDVVGLIFNNDGASKTADLTLPTDGKNMWNGSAWDTYIVSGGEDEPATSIVPEYLIVGDNAFEIVSGDSNALSSTFTATETGVVTINPSAMAIVNMIGEWEDVPAEYIGMQLGRMYALTVNGENCYEWPASVEVAAGDEVTVSLQSFMGNPAKLTVTVGFEAGSEDGGESATSTAPEYLIVGDNAFEIVSGDSNALSSTYTATEAGIVTINPSAMATVNMIGEWEDVPAEYIGMQLGRMYALTVNGENCYEWPASVEVAAGDEVTVSLQSFMGNPAKLTVTVGFEAGGEGGEGVEKEECALSETVLVLGENTLTMNPDAIFTVFEFCPEDAGVYKFTVNNAEASIGYSGGSSFYFFAPSGDLTNSFEEELKNAGPSIMVGVSNVEGEFILTIEKIGEAGGHEQNEYIDYENVHTPAEDNIADLTNKEIVEVDITKPQTVVKDENGFYHLGTVDGPVLYFNLTAVEFNVVNALCKPYGANVMRGLYTDEAGVSTKYEFLTAMKEYANLINNAAINKDEVDDNDSGLYPLTDDLMIFMKAYGGYQGWFMSGFSVFDEINAEHDATSAWLVNCVYLEDVPTEDVPGTGDYSIAGLVVAMMAATAGAVIIGKKKEF